MFQPAVCALKQTLFSISRYAQERKKEKYLRHNTIRRQCHLRAVSLRNVRTLDPSMAMPMVSVAIVTDLLLAIVSTLNLRNFFAFLIWTILAAGGGVLR